MSTVGEIEAAIDDLPTADQLRLRDWLLARTDPAKTILLPQRKAWLAGLAALRAKVATGKPSLTTDHWWDDLRGERGAWATGTLRP